MFGPALRRLSFVLTLAMAGMASSAHADDLDRRVVITNETSFSIVEFYASRVSVDDWEENMLRHSTLDAGEAGVFNFDDATGACMFDFKAVFSDGDVAFAKGVNVCKVAHYYFRE